jgi:hypothetical protein
MSLASRPGADKKIIDAEHTKRLKNKKDKIETAGAAGNQSAQG